MYRTLIDIFKTSFKLYPEQIAFRWREKKDFKTYTYAQVEKITHALAVGLIDLGVKSKEHVAIIADVSQLWTLSDIAIQLAGAIDVPRGTDSTGQELGFIISHSGSDIVLVHNKEQIEKIESGLKKVKGKVSKYIVMDDNMPEKAKKNVISMTSLIEKGQQIIEKNGKEAKELEKRISAVNPDNVATIIYTSGTTGDPKGVMLTHANLASQINILPKLIHTGPQDSGLTLLPPWHIFGRIAEYMFFATGMDITYTDIKNIGNDLRDIKPTYVPAVPRIWEGVYNKIIAGVKKQGKLGIFNFFKGFALRYYHNKKRFMGQVVLYNTPNPLLEVFVKIKNIIVIALNLPMKKLGDILVFKKVIAATGGKVKASISGGGALPAYIDEFFAAIGIKILEGYGMTETSPVIAFRRPERVVMGCVGAAIDNTELKVIDLEGNDVTDQLGVKGTLHIRGAQVMKGYYKNPKKTKEVLSDDGWMNTGDLVKISINEEITIVGRSKDTIVLTGGENIEPTPIEDKLKESEYIDHCMAVGQDKKTIGALIVPNLEELEVFVKANNIPGTGIEEWIENSVVNSLYKKEIQRLLTTDAGFKGYEKVSTFRVLKKPFEKGEEINNTFKLKRHVITDMYNDLINGMYS